MTSTLEAAAATQLADSSFRIAAMSIKRPATKERLPKSFKPTKYTVLCGRGKLCTASSGNKHLRSLVRQHLTPYSQAKNKVEKSMIVSTIVNAVVKLSPGGSFVKQDNEGNYWEVEDSFAREKIGCLFRDILHTQYRSSTKSKLARKKARETCERHIQEEEADFGDAIRNSFFQYGKGQNEDGFLDGIAPDSNTYRMLNSQVFFLSKSLGLLGPEQQDQSNHQLGQPAPHQQQQQHLSLDNFDCASTDGTSVDALNQNNCQTTMGMLPRHVGSHSSVVGASTTTRPSQLISNDSNLATLPSHRDMQLDFIKTCMPNPIRSAPPAPPQSRNKAHSLIQNACSILGTTSQRTDDFPDDLSDIFEDM